MNTLVPITENYLEYCKSQKRLDNKTIKAYRIACYPTILHPFRQIPLFIIPSLSHQHIFYNSSNRINFKWVCHRFICKNHIFSGQISIRSIHISLLDKIISINRIIHPSCVFPIPNLPGVNIQNCKIRINCFYFSIN